MDVRGQLLQTDSATMYDIARYVIKPFTKQHSCSYAERVSTAPQQPAWVVLHWWGMPFKELLTALEYHSKDRGTSTAPYWLAAFACNQHGGNGYEVEAGHQQAIEEAMALAFGTVAVVDKEGRCFKRICYLHEAHLALTRNQVRSITSTPSHAAVPSSLTHSPSLPSGHQFSDPSYVRHLYNMGTSLLQDRPHAAASGCNRLSGWFYYGRYESLREE